MSDLTNQSNWLVTFTKADHLVKEQYLTTTEKLPVLILELQGRYERWDARVDAILITPTEMVYV